MLTEIYEADPFTNAKTVQFLTFESDYRFQAGDEFFLTTERGERFKVRVTLVRLDVAAEGLRRELVVARL